MLVPRTSSKDPIRPTRGHSDLKFEGRSELTCQGFFLEKVLRTYPGGLSKDVLGTLWDYLLDTTEFLFTFPLELIRLTKSV